MFIREKQRIFVVGGNNDCEKLVQNWSASKTKKSKNFQFDSSLTAWEILMNSWKTIYGFNLIYPRFKHCSVSIAGKYIYSIGGEQKDASKKVERYQLGGESKEV